MTLLDANSKIVIPWDGSEHSKRALEKAMNMVADPGQVSVVHVAHLQVMVGPGMLPSSVDKDALISSSEQAFRESIQSEPWSDSTNFTTLVREEIGMAICDFAMEQGADLIMISSHGRTGLSRLSMGSVAERVVRYAKCPVMVLKSEYE